jgi:hypothetical protein
MCNSCSGAFKTAEVQGETEKEWARGDCKLFQYSGERP